MCRLVSYNVANLSSKINFGNFFNYINSFDVFFLFETHVLADKRVNFNSFFSNYILYWIDAKKNRVMGRPIGGCLYGFKKSIQRKYSFKFCNSQYGVTLAAKFGLLSFHFVPRYLNCTSWMSDFEDFEHLLYGMKDASFCIVGDLNARVGTAQVIDDNLLINCPLINTNRKSKDVVLDTKGRKLLSVFENIGGVIVNGRVANDSEGENTFCGVMGRSMIDYCVCSLDVLELLCDFQIGHKPFSDHFPVCVTFSSTGNDKVKDMSILPKLHWSDNKASSYIVSLNQLTSLEYLDQNIPIQEKVNICTEKIRSAAGNNIVQKRFEPKNPWFDSQCENRRKKMLKKLNTYRLTDTDVDRRAYIDSKSNYIKFCDEKMCFFLEKNIEKLDSVRSSSEWWKLVNSFKKCPPKLGNNLQIQQLYDHFKCLLNCANDVCDISWSLPNFIDPFLDAPFEIRELLTVLKEAKLNKAPGLDRISYEFYKFAPVTFKEELLKIYNHIFLKEDIPLSFKTSIIIPLFKKGDVNIASNYRGLSLLDAFYKLFTGLLLNRLNGWVESHDILNEFQAGFRKGYSTIDNLFNLTSIVQINFSLSKKTYAFFVDFSSAFDIIPRNSLFYKLSSAGLSRKMVALLQKLYENTNSRVWDGTSLSEPFNVTQGVKQGCLLSPLLFSLYLNDLHDFLPGGLVISNTIVKVLLYADDIVLLADSPSVLQSMINSLYSYCSQWCLKINLDKSKVLIFRKAGRISSNLCWNYGVNIIEIVNEYKYLGVTLSFNLSFKKHLESKLSLAKNAINASWLSYIHNQKISFSNKLKIFRAASQSILFYGAQIWGFMSFDQVEKLLRYFLKKMLYLPKNTPNYMLFLETGFSSLFLDTLNLHFGYIRKVLNLSSNRVAKILAEETIRLNVFWFPHWSELYRSSGLSLLDESWRIDIRDHHKLILETLQIKEYENFVNSARNSRLHDLYPTLQFDVDPYFRDGNSPYMVSLIFKARGGLLNLNTHIFNSHSSNLCSLCNCNAIENTYHLIGSCPIYASYRLQFFGNRILSTAEVNAILNGLDYSQLYKFLLSALKYRKLILSEFS